MSAIAPASDIEDRSDATAGARDARAWAPTARTERRAQVWYAFGRWLETFVPAGDEGEFVLA